MSLTLREDGQHRAPRYRIADVDDAIALSVVAARLFAKSYESVMDPAEMRGHLANFFSPEQQRAELSDINCTTFIALDDEIIGYAQLMQGNVPDCGIDARNPAELRRIYVDQRWHGRGVGAQLLERVEAEARRRGCDHLWLAVWDINDRAISFYRRNGFTSIGRQGFPVGSDAQTDFVMAKPLANELR